MRKTRLLLEAVERAGCQGVTFAALDLCEDSLADALTALQGMTLSVTLLAQTGSPANWQSEFSDIAWQYRLLFR